MDNRFGDSKVNKQSGYIKYMSKNSRLYELIAHKSDLS